MFLALAVPVAVTAVILALGRRDGVPMDRMFLAAIRHRTTPRTRVARPDDFQDDSHSAPAWLDARRRPSQEQPETGRRRGHAPLRLPATSVTDSGTNSSGTDVGVIDLGADGLAVAAVASTVNFALRTPAEQEALVATFGRYLHSLAAPVQVLIRAERLDLTGQVGELHSGAARLPHPAMQAAALEHADYLTWLADHTVLLRRQVLLVLREPISVAAPVDGLGGPSPMSVLASLLRPRAARTTRTRAGAGGENPARRAAESLLARRLAEAVELLAPAGITVTPLDAGRTTAVLGAACNPDSLLPSTPRRAGIDEVILGGAPPQQPDYLDGRTDYWEGDPDDDGWDYDDGGLDDAGNDDAGNDEGNYDDCDYEEVGSTATGRRGRIPSHPSGGWR